MAVDDHAIVLGVTEYPGLGKRLGGPENDARDFADWLTEPTGGQVPHANIRLILSSNYPQMQRPSDAKPTAEAFKSAVDELYELGDANQGHAGRRLYIYLAGHGFAPDLEDAALLMANAARGRTGHHVPGRPYANWFRRSAFFREVVLVMDCCRENYPLAPMQRCHLDVKTGADSTRYFYAMATAFSRPAREVPDETGRVGGVFTRTLLKGLQQGPPDGGPVTGSWLERFVHNEMPQPGEGFVPQEPRFFYERSEDIEFTLARASKYTVRLHLRERQGVGIKFFDGQFSPVSLLPVAPDVLQATLVAGLYGYQVEDDEPRVLQLIGEGGVVDVHV